MKVYKTFEEIDRDLRILRLETKIHREELKINVAEIKEDLSPVSLVGNLVGALAQKAVVMKVIGSMAGFLRTRR